MVHKIKEEIVSHLEEDIKEAEIGIKRDKELMEKLKTEEQKPVEEIKEEEDDGDVMNDYSDSMDEFLTSLDGSHKEAPATDKPKPEEIKALGE